MFFHTKTIVLCVSLYFINEAYTLKCYDCKSDAVGECFTKPKQAKFEEECKDLSSPASTPLDFTALLLKTTMNDIPQEITSIRTAEFDECWTITGIIQTKPNILRLCGISGLNTNDLIEKALKYFFPSNGIERVDEVKRCSTDSCNFSELTLTSNSTNTNKETKTPAGKPDAGADPDANADNTSGMPSLISPPDTPLILLSWISSLFSIYSAKL